METIYAGASVRSVGGVSLFDSKETLTSKNVVHYHSKPDDTEAATRLLRQAGFEVLEVGNVTINIAGPRALFEDIFKVEIRQVERRDKDAPGTLYEVVDARLPGLIETSGSPMEDLIEGIAIAEPVTLYQSPFPPNVPYWHLEAPGDVSLALNADAAHRFGLTGWGVRVAIVDTGFFPHPYFTRRRYRVTPLLGPGATGVDVDDTGHGTAMAANLLAVAPNVDLTVIKYDEISAQNAVGAVQRALNLNPQPQILSLSWGWPVPSPPLTATQRDLEAAVVDAIRQDILVASASGNGGDFGFPAQHPEVFAVGGTQLNEDGSRTASDVASGYTSTVYPGRDVPDACGLTGLQGVRYIMLPTQPGSVFDVRPDQTTTSDGWTVFSGTSSATAHAAGAAALIAQANQRARPDQIISVLTRWARDVTQGTSHPGTGANPAGPGQDLATGAGLIDAGNAALFSMFAHVQPSLFTP